MTTHSSRTTYEDSTRGMVALGVSGFAGVMLIMVAAFQILQGIAAIADDSVYVTGINYVYELDVTTWGWIHIVLGLLGVATGIGMLARQAWGLLAGIAIAILTTLTNFAFLPYYPLWSILVIAFNAFIIWALCSQIAADRPSSS